MMTTFYRKWFKIGAGAAAGIISIIGLFAFLVSYYGFEITGTDDFCAGTLDDPCVSFVNVTNPTRYNVDVYNQDEVQLMFSPEVPDYKMFRKDGRCSGKIGSSCCSPDGVCLKGWKFTDFTPATRPLEDKVYVQRFPAYSTTEFLVWGLKENPTDRVKWDFAIDASGLNNGYLDPVWEYESNKGGADNLVFHYKLDGDTLDSSGNGNDLILRDNVVLSNDGRFGLSYYFYGLTSTDLMYNYNLGRGENGTMSAWFKHPSTPVCEGTGAQVAGEWFLSWMTGQADQYQLKLSPDCTLHAEIKDSNSLTCMTSSRLTGSVPLNDSTWHHAVLTWEKDVGSVLYMDGEVVDSYSGACDTTTNTDTADIFVGAWLASYPRTFVGWIDEVRGYNRTFTASEVKELYNETKFSNSLKFYNETGVGTSRKLSFYGNWTDEIIGEDALRGYWKFDGNALDSSVYGHDGNITGELDVVNGRYNLAYFFDGVNDKIKIENVGCFNASDNFTVSFWMNRQTDLGYTMSQIRLGTGSGGWALYSRADNRLEVYDTSVPTGLYSADPYPEDVWNFVTVSFYEGNASFYKDGVFMNEVEGLIFNCPDTAITIADREGGGSTAARLKGTLDDIRIHDAVLSDSQIMGLYENGLKSHKFSVYGNPQEI